MKREEYPEVLDDINLSEEQVEKILNVIDNLSSSKNNRFDRNSAHEYQIHLRGKQDGLNTMYRFFSGTMLGHDEFEE